ncbi:MAG: DEAD/DEAH box helicase family protein [Puniceicoccales bacterium]|jgi:superfamily II DNA or RNA helicase|nr:DEAD/DEAH box helicase family protein [Puniceicoccales bacterium]
MFNQFSKHEDAFHGWRRDGMPGLKPESFAYVEFLTSRNDDQLPREGTLWPHQWEAFLRVVYAHEILGKTEIGADGLLLNVVTGGGKTAVIAALVAWLRIAHGVQKFVLLCPNLIVRDRLEDDFAGGKVFKARDLLPESAVSSGLGNFDLTTLGSGKDGGWSSLFSASVVLGNIHQFYQSNKSGQSNLAGLMNGPEFAVFNDEAHNSPAPEYEATLLRMREKMILRVDTTATPDRADGRTPDSEMIYEYSITDALADGIIKTPVVYQPDIKTVQLTYTDAQTGERRKVEEINWEEVDRLGLNATQWVTDDEPMRQQMAIALKRLEEQERRARGRWQPVLFVVAVCKADAEKAERTLADYFKVPALLVTEDSDEADRKRAQELGKRQKSGRPIKAVVSVLMLREGWDVPEVGVILLLRKFGSRVYGQQVIGRGLRRVRVKGVVPGEPQICAVVDHPKLEHQWLWDIFNARKRENVMLDDHFDETEDLPPPLPKQEMANPDLVVDVPPADPSVVDDGEFDVGDLPPPPQPVEDWQAALDQIEYDPVVAEITKVGISGVTGQELGVKGWKTVHSAPDLSEPGITGAVTDEAARDAVKMGMLGIAEELTVEAGYAAAFKERVYGAIVRHVRRKFLKGDSLGLADRADVDFARKMLRQIKTKIGAVPGLVAGIIEYDN